MKLTEMASNQPPARSGRNARSAAPDAAPTEKRPRRSRKDSAQQDAGTVEQQGGDPSTDKVVEQATQQAAEIEAPAAPQEIGGIKIEVMALPTRGGRTVAPERYPFGTVPLSKVTAEGIVGPSFFVPETDASETKLASARKRYPDFIFHSRKQTEGGVKGLRVWKTAKETTGG